MPGKLRKCFETIRNWISSVKRWISTVNPIEAFCLFSYLIGVVYITCRLPNIDTNSILLYISVWTIKLIIVVYLVLFFMLPISCFVESFIVPDSYKNQKKYRNINDLVVFFIENLVHGHL